MYTDTSDIPSDMDALCICDSGKRSKECCAKGVEGGAAGGFDGEAVAAMWEAVNKIDLLTEKMKGLEKQIY